MKQVVLLCDGMADTPCESLGGKTPMEAAHKPAMDALVRKAEVGLARTVPDGMAPGSDVANLSVLGYHPQECYTGRSPLEAANLGIQLADGDVAMRCNLVTLSDEPLYEDKTLVDYCAGDIHTADADRLVRDIQKAFGGGEFNFYTGTAYRHCLVWSGGTTELGKVTPPHDITGRVIGPYLMEHPAAAKLRLMMEKSYDLLRDHPVNRERAAKGLPPANAIWLWGQGSRPRLQNFEERFGVKGAMISAVDLLKGIGRLSGMTVCSIPGATGYIDTDYEAKRDAALRELRAGRDMAYIHVEAPDECGHRGEAENKVRAIEDIDRRILTPLLAELEQMGDYAILIMPDHPTPLALRTHTADSVPYLLYRSRQKQDSGVGIFTERTAASTGVFVERADTLMGRLLNH